MGIVNYGGGGKGKKMDEPRWKPGQRNSTDVLKFRQADHQKPPEQGGSCSGKREQTNSGTQPNPASSSPS